MTTLDKKKVDKLEENQVDKSNTIDDGSEGQDLEAQRMVSMKSQEKIMTNFVDPK